MKHEHIRQNIKRTGKQHGFTDGIAEAEAKSIIELAKISAKIERRRLELNMTQKEFAAYMNVSQGMVSRWESREYNFTIKTLNEICQKLNLHLQLDLTLLLVSKIILF